MDNLIEVWGRKNINKPNKPLKFDAWETQSYWIDPAIIDFIDPIALTVHCDKVVFKLHHEKAINELIEKINEK